MNDYLWNAAARALEHAPVVRPRLAPLFGEPDLMHELPAMEFRQERFPPVEANLTFEKPIAPVEPNPIKEANPQIRPAALKVGPVSPEPTRQSEPQLSQMKIESVVPFRRFQREIKQQLGRDSQIPLNRPTSSHKPQSQEVQPAASIKISPIFQEPVSHLHADSQPDPIAVGLQERTPLQANAAHETVALRVMKPLPEKTRLGQEPSVPKPRVSSAAEQLETVNHSEGRSPSIRVNVARNPVPSPFSRNTAVEPVSTIQVTIGRVEVRAVPAEQKINLATSKQSSNSLEDYLKRRSRGGGE